jgi:hypothetical protein
MTDQPTDPVTEMRRLERLWRDAPHSTEFFSLQRKSKWGESIRTSVVAGIEAQRPESIADGILFVEVSPRFFRSGYHKALVAGRLKSVTLSESQRERLRNVILAGCESSLVGPEFSEYARLARTVIDDEFCATVAQHAQTARGWSRGRWLRLARMCQQCDRSRHASKQ